MDQNRQQIPSELLPVIGRLTNERPKPTDTELDRIKLRAVSGTRSVSRPGRGLVKSRRVVGVAVAAVLVGSGGAVFAKTSVPPSSASAPSSASQTQYCPPSSQQPGNPKNPGPSKCGSPKTK